MNLCVVLCDKRSWVIITVYGPCNEI